MNGYNLTVFVVAENADGEPEILAYDIAATQEDVEDSKHYDAARAKAENEGYVVQAMFDSSDMAGRQLLGKTQIYGDKARFTWEI